MPTALRTLKPILVTTILAAAAAAQTSPPNDNRYEVVSIKAVNGPGRCGYHPTSVLFRLEGCPLDYLVKTLYSNVEEWGIVGLPKWTASASYDIEAKSAKPANPREQWEMLKAPLEDRFQLKWHREKREMQVYSLTAAEGGIKLPVTAPQGCVPIDPNVAPTPPGPKTPPYCGMLLDGRPRKGEVKLDGSGIAMSRLVLTLEHHLGRPVVDNTGSSLLFDVHLEYDGGDLSVNEPTGLPTVFAVLKKAGLALKPAKAPVEVLVIDSVQRPAEN